MKLDGDEACAVCLYASPHVWNMLTLNDTLYRETFQMLLSRHVSLG